MSTPNSGWTADQIAYMEQAMKAPLVAVVEVAPSAHWANAEVLILACEHRHVRPRGWKVVGETLHCCFCGDADPQKP